MWWPSLILSAQFARRAGASGEFRKAIDEVVKAIAEIETVGDPQEWHVELVLGRWGQVLRRNTNGDPAEASSAARTALRAVE